MTRFPIRTLPKQTDDVLKSMNEVGYLSNEDYEKAVSSPLKIVQKETEGTDENYQSSYAIHCAALELMKMDGFEFQYTFDNKERLHPLLRTLYCSLLRAVRSDTAGGFQIYTSLDSGLQAVLQTQIDASLSGFTELQENGKICPSGSRRDRRQQDQLCNRHCRRTRGGGSL